MSITTRYGDKGRTQLFSGENISKADPRTEAYGTLDEAMSIVGVARSLMPTDPLAEELVDLQRRSFVVGAELATDVSGHHLLRQRVDEAFLLDLDQRRDALEAAITMPTGFVLPGGTPAAAHLDHARSVVRRCERCVVRMIDEGLEVSPLVLRWINRLSDYLWLMARKVEGERVLPKNA